MAEIVLRVRLLSGDQTDVSYVDQEEADDEALLDDVVEILSSPHGALRCRHGERTLVLFGRGVASVEVAPRGAVL
jgi:predicted site-specific integrase-resolvase